MKVKYSKIWLIAAALLMMSLLTACNLRVGWISTNVPGHLKARFTYFSGEAHRNFTVKKGETIRIQYKSEVKKGTISMNVIGPDKQERLSLPIGKEGTKEIKAEQDGKYQIYIEGQKARGSFDVSWKVE